VVSEDGVDVAREELGCGELGAVEQLGVIWSKLYYGEVGRGCECVSENGVDEDAGAAKL